MSITDIALGVIIAKVGLWFLGVVLLLGCAVIVEIIKKRQEK